MWGAENSYQNTYFISQQEKKVDFQIIRGNTT